MPVVYSDFMREAANYVAGGSPSEIACRMSMSRAYYGAYHASLAYADTVSTPPVSDQAGKTHEKLRVFYSTSFHPNKDVRLKHRSVGYKLKQAHDCRVIADYKINLTVNDVAALAQLGLCNELVEKVDILCAAAIAS